MVLLVAKINKLCSKLENFRHHRRQSSEENILLEESLQGFFSAIVSNGFSKLSSSSEVASFPWIQSCFELIPMANKAFAKLVVAIDHPASNWRSGSIEKYLNYSLKLLEQFNLISASLSRLSRARVSLSHGSSLAEEKFPQSALKHLRAIDSLAMEIGDFDLGTEEAKSHRLSKEEAIHRALMAMENLGLWVCGAVLSSLSGDRRPYSETKLHSSFARLEAKVETTKEVRDVNESVARLVAAIDEGKSYDGEARELRRGLEAFEKGFEGLENEVNRVFREVLRGRNQMISGFQAQHRKE